MCDRAPAETAGGISSLPQLGVLLRVRERTCMCVSIFTCLAGSFFAFVALRLCRVAMDTSAHTHVRSSIQTRSVIFPLITRSMRQRENSPSGSTCGAAPESRDEQSNHKLLRHIEGAGRHDAQMGISKIKSGHTGDSEGSLIQ